MWALCSARHSARDTQEMLGGKERGREGGKRMEEGEGRRKRRESRTARADTTSASPVWMELGQEQTRRIRGPGLGAAPAPWVSWGLSL